MNDYTHIETIPYKSVFDLRLLVEFWEEKLNSVPDSPWASQLFEQIAAAPELKAPVYDLAALDKHKDLIGLMMGAVIPYAGGKSDIAAAVVPFHKEAFYSTPAFREAFDYRNIDEVVSINVPGSSYTFAATLKASLQVLKRFYGVALEHDRPLLITVKNPDTGLEKVYKVNVDDRFCRVIAKETPEPIDPSILKFLTEKIYDLDLILQYIRPDNFEFHGFLLMRLADVTQEEMLSAIKYDLIARDAVGNPESFRSIQQKLRSIMNQPDLVIGLAYFDPNNNLILNNSHSNCWKSITEMNPGDYDYSGSVYERSWVEKRYITIEDIETYPFRSKIENSLLENGIRSILLAPLVDDHETIGLLELASPRPGMLTPASATKVENAIPMFTIAVKRVKSEMETEVRALIQQECTAIHPAVQWRFFEAGLRLMNQRRSKPDTKLEEIVFNNVYPFFGMVDIRNSSRERNRAIQQDLQENLMIAKRLLERLLAKVKLPLIEELIFRTDKHIGLAHQSLSSGDEINVLEFIKREIHPVLDHFAGDLELNKWIDEYKAALDPKFGVIYKRRGAFEETLSQINTFVGGIVDHAEDSAQQMFPHYFEKYKTDGVEFTLYLGESLLQDRNFNEFYLRNFRLWQLILMCSIEQQMVQIKPSLKTPLDITQLILVHDQPVTIRFRADEKRFDVDGAYDIRYEIIKKRIDKARIKDEKASIEDEMERLTKPGKIAIVYSQPKVAIEYKEYFSHLRSKKLITGEVEDFELEELPGAIGLRALRVTVAPLDTDTPHEMDVLRHIEEAMQLNH